MNPYVILSVKKKAYFHNCSFYTREIRYLFRLTGMWDKKIFYKTLHRISQLALNGVVCVKQGSDFASLII